MTRMSNFVFLALIAVPTSTPQAQAKECTEIAESFPDYSLEGNSAHFVVTQLGNVLFRPTRPIDEDDRIMVHVITTRAAAPLLRVRRKSAFRTVGTINIVGSQSSDTQPHPETALNEGSLCDLTLELADFAPGRAEVEIALVAPEAGVVRETSLGTFDFAVQPLYTGAFSLGAIRSELEDPKFGLIRRGEDSVVTETETGDTRVLYALLYTAFVWGKKDLEKPSKHWYERVNPSMGVSLKNLSDNAFIGVPVDLPLGVFLNWGLHAGNVTELDPNSGLSNGSVVAQGPVPTRKRWRTKPYAGVTVDLRAALKLLRSAASTTVQ